MGTSTRLTFFCAALLGVALHARTARADDIPVVTINGDTVIDRSFPLPKPFTLRSPAAPGVSAVQAMFVRYARPALAFSPSDDEGCAALRPRVLAEVKQNPALLDAKGADVEILDEAAYLPPRWLAPSGASGPDEKRFSATLVSNRPFFVTNGHFCLFMFERVAIQHREAFSIRQAIQNLRAMLDQVCGATPTIGCYSGVATTVTASAMAAFDELDTHGLSSAVEPRKKARNELESLLRGRLTQGATGFFQARKSSTDLIAVWPGLWRPQRTIGPDAARFLAKLLVANNLLVTSTDGQTIRFPQTNAVVREIVPTSDLTQLVVTYEREGAKLEQLFLKRATAAIALPGNSGATLHDLLALASGRILVDDGLEPVSGLSAEALAAARAPLGRLSKHFDDAGDAIRRIHDCYGRQPCVGPGRPESAEDELVLELAAWLRPHLTPCKKDQPGLDERCTPGPAFWDGYATVTPEGRPSDVGDPLRQLLLHLDEVARLEADLAALPAEVSFQVETVSWEATRIELALSVELSRSSFVTHFLPTFIGYATVLGPDTYGVPYLGVQFYLWPNNPDEPMWINRSEDLRRLFAFELGFGIGSEGRGQDGRFSGPRVFAGGSFQLLPYLKASAGAAFMQERDSTLAIEETDLAVYPYVGVSGEINVLGFVYLLATDPSGSVGRLIPKASNQ